MTIERLHQAIDTAKLAEKAGLKVFDTALPLAWYEDVHRKTGFWPQVLGFVWCYDVATVYGAPYALTEAAEVLLQYYDHMLVQHTRP